MSHWIAAADRHNPTMTVIQCSKCGHQPTHVITADMGCPVCSPNEELEKRHKRLLGALLMAARVLVTELEKDLDNDA